MRLIPTTATYIFNYEFHVSRNAEEDPPSTGAKPGQTAAAATPEGPETARPGVDPQPPTRPQPRRRTAGSRRSPAGTGT